MSTGEGRRSSKKCLAYVAAFVVFQTAIILLFVLIVMKVRSPKVTIKNNNFGDFKYENSTLSILYNGVKVGEAVVPQGKAGPRKTKKFNVSVDLSGIRDRVGNDLNSGVFRLSSRGTVSGKVQLIKVIKRNKSGEMKCDWSINLATRQFEDLKCN
ncbi:hypothetical protein Sango_1196400 [Sesamum angolense]|uniref:Late embryogenesis abundant protein LEA-2 subgroup domain-containing protein n=1 Tax=Sesamum angolense TaxID=2727404 RepID=A0AAE1WX35_9LAMI|nr:hypothetical protein Sango_1196400 [Sesamum angolense]